MIFKPDLRVDETWEDIRAWLKLIKLTSLNNAGYDTIFQELPHSYAQDNCHISIKANTWKGFPNTSVEMADAGSSR